MRDLLIKCGIPFEGEFIKIPDWCKRIKIDVGLSENAPQSQKWLEAEEETLIFGFEPNPYNVEKIKNGTSRFPIKLDTKYINSKIYIVQCALSNVSEKSSSAFYCTESDPGCSSLLKPKRFKVQEEIVVDTYPLNEFLSFIPFHKIEYIDFIKTDCQGTDFEIAKSASKFFDKIAIYTCEADNWRYKNSKNGKKQIDQFFNDHGFVKYNKYKKLFDKSYCRNIQTDDPTYINSRLAEKIKRDNVTAYQKG